MIAPLLRTALAGAILGLAALLAGRIGQHGTLPDALLSIGGQRAAEVAGLGAALAVVGALLPRLLPAFTARALRGGFWTGVIAMAILQQGATFLLFHLFQAVPDPGFGLEALPALGGVPAYVALLLAGGLAGALLALALQWLPLLWLPLLWLPAADLLLGVAAGALGLSQLAGLLPLPPLTLEAPGWWANLATNGLWGLGTALMLRPLELFSRE